MHLKLERVDTYYGRTTSDQYCVLDELTGQSVGTVSIDRHDGRRRLTRTVQLFDKKYRGTFETHAECVAFVKGVEAVLNYLAEGHVEVALNHVLKAKLAPSDADAARCRRGRTTSVVLETKLCTKEGLERLQV